MRWETYLDALKLSNAIRQNSAIDYSDDDIAEFLFMNLTQAFLLFSRADVDRPEFIPYANPYFNHSAINPDNSHYFAIIDGRKQYRISGYRGTVHVVEFQTGYNWPSFSENAGRSTNIVSMSDFKVEEDGYFEILASNERPEDYKGNWIQTEANNNYLMVRQVGYVPGEVDAKMAIESLSPASTEKRPSFDGAAVKRMVDYVQYHAIVSLGYMQDIINQVPINHLKNFDYGNVAGVANQVYQQGPYDIARDQAMVLTFKAPEVCYYWNIQTTDLRWHTNEAVYAQGHLNGHIDRSDGDGLIRLVLSHEDPGVANWVDLGGVEQGLILIRWLRCSSTPEPKINLVAIDEVDARLPDDTRRVSHQERQLEVRKRAVARQLRRYW